MDIYPFEGQWAAHGPPNGGSGRQKSGPSGPPPGCLAVPPPHAAKDAVIRSQAGTASSSPGNPRAVAPASPGRGRNGHRSGAMPPSTYPQKIEGSNDRLNAARAKPEERKRHRRACGKAKRHLPGLLLPLLPVQSPMQASYASGVAKDRHESAPSRAACLNGSHAVPRQAAARRTNLALQGGAWLMWLAGQGILADER